MHQQAALQPIFEAYLPLLPHVTHIIASPRRPTGAESKTRKISSSSSQKLGMRLDNFIQFNKDFDFYPQLASIVELKSFWQDLVSADQYEPQLQYEQVNQLCAM